MTTLNKSMLIGLSLIVATQTAYAADKEKTDLFKEYAPSLSDYITPLFDINYRYEFVDQYSKKNADASTFSTRFGFETKKYRGFQFLVEGEHVGLLGNDTYYSTVNGKSKFAKVPDPEVTELNRLSLSTDIIPQTNITVGRQHVAMGSKRFIGSQNWRRNHTTYDAVTISNTSLPDTKISYAYIMKQHNNLGYDEGGNIDTETHAVDVQYSGLPFTDITPYMYLIEDEDTATKSNATYGVYLSRKNKISNNLYTLHDLEYARQSDYQNNTNSFDLDYYRIDGGVKWNNISARVGFSSAEGDGTTGVITHFAANHKFLGWEDKFLTIPADGIEDTYVELAYKLKGTDTIFDGLKLVGQYHDFNAENSGDHYGEEFDFKIAKQITPHVNMALYYETYSADTFSKDTDKVIFQLGFEL